MAGVQAKPDFLGYKLRCLSNLVEASFVQKLKAQKLTITQWIVLRWLYEAKEANFGQVVSFIGLDQGAVSRVCKSLERKQLIQYRKRADDRRSTFLSLTDNGKYIVHDVSKLAAANDKEMFGTLSSIQRKDLNKLVNMLILDLTGDFGLLQKW